MALGNIDSSVNSRLVQASQGIIPTAQVGNNPNMYGNATTILNGNTGTRTLADNAPPPNGNLAGATNPNTGRANTLTGGARALGTFNNGITGQGITNNGYGGHTPTSDGHNYNADMWASMPSWMRYQAWAAAGFPTHDQLGRQLDTTGAPIRFGFDPNGGPPGGTENAPAPPPPAGTNNNGLVAYTGNNPITMTNGGGTLPNTPTGITNPPTTTGNPTGNNGTGPGVGNNGTNYLNDTVPPPTNGGGVLGGVGTTAPPPTIPNGTGNTPVTNPPTTTPNNTGQDTGASNWQYWVNQLTNNGQRPPTGTIGFNVGTHIVNYAGLGGTYTQPDAVTNQFGYWEPAGGSEAGGDTLQFHATGAYAALIQRGLLQVANDDGSLPNDGSIIDYSRLTYDPQFGIVSPIDNIRVSNRAGDITFALGLAGMGIVAMPYILAAGSTAAPGVAGGTAGSLTGPPAILGAEIPGAMATLPTGSGVGTLTGAATAGGAASLPGWLTSGAGRIGTSVAGNLILNGLNGSGNTSGGKPTGTVNNPNGNNDPFNLGNAITGGINNWQTNQNIQEFQNWINNAWNRGDYNSPYREQYLQILQQLMTNPDAALQSSGYRAMREHALGDLSRQYAARGMSLSGNEMGALESYGNELDWKQIQNERDQFMKAANLGNPGGLAQTAMSAGANLFQARQDRNAALNAVLQRAGLGNLLNRMFDGKGVTEWLRGLFKGEWTLDDVPDELRTQFEAAAANYGLSVDEYVSQLQGSLPEDLMPDINIDNGDGDNWWMHLFEDD